MRAFCLGVLPSTSESSIADAAFSFCSCLILSGGRANTYAAEGEGRVSQSEGESVTLMGTYEYPKEFKRRRHGHAG